MILIFRISAMDMLQGGLAWDEIVSLAKALEARGST
jgi:2,4-dienoyl-CoA reductase (NADPH2)